MRFVHVVRRRYVGKKIRVRTHHVRRLNKTRHRFRHGKGAPKGKRPPVTHHQAGPKRAVRAVPKKTTRTGPARRPGTKRAGARTIGHHSRTGRSTRGRSTSSHHASRGRKR